MEVYLYRLMDFAFTNDEETKNSYKETHLLETKLKCVLAMGYGYFNIGMNYIEIYPYHDMGIPSRPIFILNDQEQPSPEENYSMILPYQNKQMAKDVFSKWLEAFGYKVASQAVKKNAVTHLKRMSFGLTNEDISYAKRWDKIKTTEYINDLCEHIQDILQ